MRFKKTGKEIIASIEKSIEDDRTALAKTSEYFEREKEKSALQRMRELELNIERLQRIIRHTVAGDSYELTEQDLIDFGFD